MKLRLRGIKDHGHNDERAVIEVLEDADLGRYILLDTTYYPSGKISNELRHTYWFPDERVKKGDFVVVYTKEGSDKSSPNKRGTISHIFYWNLDSNVWNNEGDYALLFELKTWAGIRVK